MLLISLVYCILKPCLRYLRGYSATAWSICMMLNKH